MINIPQLKQRYLQVVITSVGFSRLLGQDGSNYMKLQQKVNMK